MTPHKMETEFREIISFRHPASHRTRDIEDDIKSYVSYAKENSITLNLMINALKAIKQKTPSKSSDRNHR